MSSNYKYNTWKSCAFNWARHYKVENKWSRLCTSSSTQDHKVKTPLCILTGEINIHSINSSDKADKQSKQQKKMFSLILEIKALSWFLWNEYFCSSKKHFWLCNYHAYMSIWAFKYTIFIFALLAMPFEKCFSTQFPNRSARGKNIFPVML